MQDYYSLAHRIGQCVVSMGYVVVEKATTERVKLCKLFGFCIGEPTDGQLHPFTQSSETGQGAKQQTLKEKKCIYKNK